MARAAWGRLRSAAIVAADSHQQASRPVKNDFGLLGHLITRPGDALPCQPRRWRRA